MAFSTRTPADVFAETQALYGVECSQTVEEFFACEIRLAHEAQERRRAHWEAPRIARRERRRALRIAREKEQRRLQRLARSEERARIQRQERDRQERERRRVLDDLYRMQSAVIEALRPHYGGAR